MNTYEKKSSWQTIFFFKITENLSLTVLILVTIANYKLNKIENGTKRFRIKRAPPVIHISQLVYDKQVVKYVLQVIYNGFHEH